MLLFMLGSSRRYKLDTAENCPAGGQTMFRILVVDDDRIANRVMCATLRSNGYDTVAAFDGEEALEMLDKKHIDREYSGQCHQILAREWGCSG